MQLHKYQDYAIRSVHAFYTKGVKRVLLVAPTGSGKTVIAGHVIRSALAKGKRVVFFAHRKILIKQTYDKLIKEAGIPAECIGILMGNDPLANSEAPIQIVSIDTFPHREPPPADLVIIDEAHRSLAQTYLDAIEHYMGVGAYLLGLTATPWRADGKGLGDVYEKIVLAASPKELIERGYLDAPRVFGPSADNRPDLSAVSLVGADYSEAELEDIMNTARLVGDIVDHWKRLSEGRATVLFAVSIKHSMACVDAFLRAGIPAEHMDGTTPERERKAILARLDAGTTKIVCNCGVLCEGWHQKAVKCVVMARPTKSLTLYIQQGGRILSPWGGQTPLILDHAGNAFEHGLPHAERIYLLTNTRPKKERFQDTKSCECGAILATATRRCPECGYEFAGMDGKKWVYEDGELVEMEELEESQLLERAERLEQEWLRDTMERRAKGLRPVNPRQIEYQFEHTYHRRLPEAYTLPIVDDAKPEEKERVFLQLVAEGERKGRKPGWKWHVFREIFGHWPAADHGLPPGWNEGG